MKVGSVSPVLIIEDFGLEADADGDVAVGAVDGAEDRPDLVLVGQIDDRVARGAPQAVVVFDDQLKGNVAFEIAARGVGLFDGQLAALEHLDAERLFVALAAGGDRDRGLDGADETDLHRFEIVRLGDRAAGAGVFELLEKMFLEGLDIAEGFDIGRRVGVVGIRADGDIRHGIGAGLVDTLEGDGDLRRDIDAGINGGRRIGRVRRRDRPDSNNRPTQARQFQTQPEK